MSAAGPPIPSHVVLEFRGDHPSSLEQTAAQHPDLLTVVATKSLSAFDYVTQVVVTLTPLAVGLLTPIITEHVRAKREMRIKRNGVTQSSKDVSLEDLLDQLQRLVEPEGHRPDTDEPDS